MKSYAIKVSNSSLFVTDNDVSIHPQITCNPDDVCSIINQFESSLIDKRDIECRLIVIQFDSSSKNELKEIVQFESSTTGFQFIPYLLWLNMERVKNRKLAEQHSVSL